jgi:hypothetical protein
MRGAAALAGAAVLPAIYRAAVRTMLRRNIRAVNAGDPEPLFSSYAEGRGVRRVPRE